MIDRSDFSNSLAQIVQKEGLQQALTWTGEQLALADSQMQANTPTPQMADDMLFAASAHLACLAEAGLYVDAMATGVMAILTMLRHGITPPHLPRTYTALIANLAFLPQAVDMQTNMQYSAQWQTIAAQIAALTKASAQKFFPQGAPPEIEQALRQLQQLIDMTPAENLRIDGADITPTHAADIFTQAIVLLAPFIEA